MWVVLAVGLIAAPTLIHAADTVQTVPSRSSSSTIPAFLLDVPPEAQAIAPALRTVLHVVQSSIDAEQAIRQLRAEHDAVKTKLAAASGELHMLDEQRRQVAQELSVVEREARERMEMVRRELEGKLEQELEQGRQNIAQEHQEDFTRQVQGFETRQSEAITGALIKELELKERELQQLSQELAIQTEGLVNQFSRLDLDANVAQTIQRSAQEALARKQAELELQRSKIEEERAARLANARAEFAAKLQQQYATEAERRVTLKEASLRSVMAELLHKTSQEEHAKTARARQRLAELESRREAVAQRQAQWAAKADAHARQLEEKIQLVQQLNGQRQTSLAKLEQAFQNPQSVQHEKALVWFTQALPAFPPEIAADLEALQQRLTALIQQERQLAEQRRMLRERQLALQLSRELELQYQRNQMRQQQEEQARAKRAEEFVVRANELTSRGQFDDALRVLAQAQAMNPPQRARIGALRDEVLAAKAEAARKQEAAKVEQLFSKAMTVFQQGNYEDAVTLFQGVIDEEARLQQPSGAAD